MSRQRISLVIPAYNEESNIPLLRERLLGVIDVDSPYEFEVIIVDDHSTDRTAELVKNWADEDSRVHLLRLSRNFGSHAALCAGLSVYTGDAAALLAADLQDPPEMVLSLAAKWREGNDVVWAVRAAREGEKLSVRLFSRIYYATLRRLALAEMPTQGADFLLLDRKVIDAYLKIPEKNTSFMCMVLWMGFRQCFVPYVKRARASGVTKWTYAKKIKLFIDSIVSFSFVPIRTMSWFGIFFALAGFGFAAYVVAGRLFGWVVAGTGYAALMTALLVGFGMVLLSLGIIGEYLWRTFDEARGRPRFIVEERYPLGETHYTASEGESHESREPSYVDV
jgi:polyisoprenyl-phosphate glycosyltransferase